MKRFISRHEFLHAAARAGLLLGLAGAGAAAIRGSKDPADCINTGYCSTCKAYRSCTLPERAEVTHGHREKA